MARHFIYVRTYAIGVGTLIHLSNSHRIVLSTATRSLESCGISIARYGYIIHFQLVQLLRDLVYVVYFQRNNKNK